MVRLDRMGPDVRVDALFPRRRSDSYSDSTTNNGVQVSLIDFSRWISYVIEQKHEESHAEACPCVYLPWLGWIEWDSVSAEMAC